MKEKKTLLDRAKMDLYTCKVMIESEHDDELYIDIAK